jgi:glycosyltransferase involved in cell wall biosynthesis
LCDAITFIGNLPLVEEILTGADLFLLPSETESFGLAALEALSCEVPVIATAVGGLPEVVVEGENGHLLPVGDVEAMAAAAIALLRDRPRHQRFRTSARRWAVERFAADRVIGQYRDVYRSVLAGR